MSTPPPVNFGEELKDSFKPVNAWVANGISWLEDVQAFYRERAAIEKEYATKINALSKRYYDKKARKSAGLSVGDAPLTTPGSLESASLTTWTTILTTTEAVANEHDVFSTALTSQVADALKSIVTRYDDYRKRHESLAAKLQAERDGVYAEVRKAKGRYDEECKLVEEKRQKADKSFDAGKSKAQRSYQVELAEMNNVKNSYLLQVEVTNRHKRRYYHEDLPEIINSLQDLNETRVHKLNNIWTLSSNLENTCRQNVMSHLSNQISEIARNLPVLDSGMFAKHNVYSWAEPSNFVFEPSPVWHDNSNMVVDEQAQVYLRNLLQKSRKGMDGLKGEVERRGKEIQQLSENRDRVKLDENLVQKELDVMRELLFFQEDILPHATKLLTYQVETETIIATVGDLVRGTQSHNFKSTTFKIPTNCDFCYERIWGLTSKGFTCTDCGYSCHSKCEMKVPATCPGVLDKAAKRALKEEKKSGLKDTNGAGRSEVDLSGSDGLSRSNTMNSLSSSYATGGGALGPARATSHLSKSPSFSGISITSISSAAAAPPVSSRRIIAPPPERYVAPAPAQDSSPSTPDSSMQQGKLLYTFAADGANELAVSEGEKITILDDDGAWMTIRRRDGEEGLVPTSYVEKLPTPAPQSNPPPLTARPTSVGGKAGKRGPPPPVKPRGSKKKEHKVRALYAYNPRGEDEVEMEAGEDFVVLERDVAGWVKVKVGANGEGLVPGTYVEDV